MDRRRFVWLTGSAFAASLLADLAAGDERDNEFVIEEGFEGEIPDFHTYRAKYAADAAKAHTGKRSLRIIPTEGKSPGGAYFKLDGLIDLSSDYEFSAWVYMSEDETARLYISARDGKRRYVKAEAAGGKAGKWVKLTGCVRRKDWKDTDRDIMLAMVTVGQCWFDDVTLQATTLPPPPIETYPELQATLYAEAARRATTLTPRGQLTLDAGKGAFAPDIQSLRLAAVAGHQVPIPADGFLTFAIDASEAMYVTGTVSLLPDKDLRPGLRAYVLCDSTLVAAPMVAADPWQGVGNPLTGPAPDCNGTRPPRRVELVQWLIAEGRHYLTVAGPHFRPGGVFERLEIRATDKPVDKPLYQFALLADTHIGSGRSTWMNVKMSDAVPDELTATLKSLRDEETAFAVIAGDMTDGATRDQFQTLADVLKASGLPVYGCIGNHDAYHAASRSDALELCSALFPGAKTDYYLGKPPIRFVTLDGSHYRAKDGSFLGYYDPKNSGGIGLKPEEIAWLRETLAADTTTPTMVVWHYPLYNRVGPSSCGYKIPSWARGQEVLKLLRAAPNVIATLTGHTHWNEVNDVEGIAHIQNAAYCEWPNSYRVFRVYPDRMEWETRQVANRGFVRESFVVPKALSWMISTGAGDLAGEVPLSLRG